jgi:hypothetical protein
MTSLPSLSSAAPSDLSRIIPFAHSIVLEFHASKENRWSFPVFVSVEESNLEQVEVLLKSDDDIDISSWELQVCFA